MTETLKTYLGIALLVVVSAFGFYAGYRVADGKCARVEASRQAEILTVQAAAIDAAREQQKTAVKQTVKATVKENLTVARQQEERKSYETALSDNTTCVIGDSAYRLLVAAVRAANADAAPAR